MRARKNFQHSTDSLHTHMHRLSPHTTCAVSTDTTHAATAAGAVAAITLHAPRQTHHRCRCRCVEVSACVQTYTQNISHSSRAHIDKTASTLGCIRTQVEHKTHTGPYKSAIRPLMDCLYSGMPSSNRDTITRRATPTWETRQQHRIIHTHRKTNTHTDQERSTRVTRHIAQWKGWGTDTQQLLLLRVTHQGDK